MTAPDATTTVELTAQERDDLARMAAHYVRCCTGGACDHHDTPEAQRMRTLAARFAAGLLPRHDDGVCRTCGGADYVHERMWNGTFPVPCPSCQPAPTEKGTRT